MSVPPEGPRSPEEILHDFLEAHPEPSPGEVEALCAEHSAGIQKVTPCCERVLTGEWT